ncbi:hypothetical protein AN958_08411 [Leucoagaricus sp. SymC.cos]|nr:hypothetical protein AN958_08411 [Leucoagaricus sp. SymC.cos]
MALHKVLSSFPRVCEINSGVGLDRSVMPLDVLGCMHTTLTEPVSFSPWPEGLGNLVKLCHAGDRALQLLLFNKEYVVSMSHQLTLIMFLPFIHTAHHYYQLNGLVRSLDWLWGAGNGTLLLRS